MLYCSFGGGHLSTANALKNKMEQNPNVKVSLVDALDYVDTKFNKFSVNFYNFISRSLPSLWNYIYHSSDDGMLAGLTVSQCHRLSKKIVSLVEETKPEQIVCTHAFPLIMTTYLKLQGKIDKDIPISVIITDYEIHKQWHAHDDVITNIFVGSDEMKQDLLNAGVPSSNIYVTGIPIRDEFAIDYDENTLDEFKDSLNIPKDKKIATIFGGGANGISSSKIFHYINRFIENLADYHFIAISGKNDTMYDKFLSLQKDNNLDNMTVIKFSNEISKILQISDFIISKPGGLTTSEATAKGTALMIMNPLPGQEIANTVYLEKNKAGVLLTKNNLNDIISEIKNNPNFVSNMRDQAKKIGKPHASQKVIDILLGNDK